MFFVYILKSTKDNHSYIGRTNDLKRRLQEHNNGRVRSTKARVPMVLLKAIEVETENESVVLEKELKKGYKREELKREFGLR